MSSRPRAVVVGASSASALGEVVLCVDHLDDIAPYLGDPQVTLAIADTAPQSAELTRVAAVSRHTLSGGRVVILRATDVAGALTWDTPAGTDEAVEVATELGLPASTDALARALAIAPPLERATVVSDLLLRQHRELDDPVIGFKCGLLWLDQESRGVLVSGHFAREPVPPTSWCPAFDPNGQYFDGFHAWVDRSRADAYAPGAPVFTVALAGRVDVVGSPRGGLILVAAHQRVVAVDLSGRCRVRDCRFPSTNVSGTPDSNDPTRVDERCDSHRRDAGLALEELRERLDREGATLHVASHLAQF